MLRTPRLALILALAIGVVLTFLRVPVASSQGLTLVAAEIEGPLPVDDPTSDLWQESLAVEVPLNAQNVARPMLLETRVRSITARALHDRSQIAFLVEWTDATQDASAVRVQDFRDAVALQFPLAEGPPFFCMGQQGGNVNIWHWKADWQADQSSWQDMETAYPDMYVDQYPFADPAAALAAGPATYDDPNYLPAMAVGNLFAMAERPSPVEDLAAGGFGTLTAQPASAQNVQGFGLWEDRAWRVIFSRDLRSGEPDDVVFHIGGITSIALAVWDGSNGERNGEKSTSQWLSLQLEGLPEPSQAEEGPTQAPRNLEFLFVVGPGAAVLAFFILLLLVLGAIGFLQERRRLK